MRGFYTSFLSLLLLLSFLKETNAAPSKTHDGVYIVYMGASPSTHGAFRNDHAQLLDSLMKRNKNSVIQTYNKGFSGFAVHLSEEEARSIAQNPGVVSVFPDPILHLHTTRSWNFLKYQTSVKIDSDPISTSGSFSNVADTVIGILDTGIWPESESFVDEDLGPIPSHWKGQCMTGQNFNSSSCNRKLIGARYYDDPDSIGTPRDESGHGTHVASTAAGRAVFGASYYGLANGTATGGSPGSRIAIYRVCTPNGCQGSSILKAFDDAIADGVDVLSLSLGSSSPTQDFGTDPIAIGAFHAVEKGIIVVCSAGNNGPSSATVVYAAPWILTTAATTIDRDFETNVVLGGNKTIKGGGINLSNLKKSAVYPLIDGNSARSNSEQDSEDSSFNCIPGSLDDDKVKGKIVLCDNTDEDYETDDKFDALKSQGAIGMILVDDDRKQVPSTYGTSPIVAVTEEDGAQILSYIKSNSNPLGTILPTVVVLNYKPAPVVPYFSSRGPTHRVENLLKPDVAAPGVAILAAWPSDGTDEAIPGLGPPLFDILSGTSMACPHVSGLAAVVKSHNPTWSPSAIRSAIMTTAIQTNNLHSPITTETGSIATPYDIGAGEISLSSPLQPGLVYETETIDYIQFLCNIGYDTTMIKRDYIQFLCNIGYDTTMIKRIASSLPSNFSCSVNSNSDSVSNMNYPSIAIFGLKENERKTINRRVTNVGEEDSTTYTVIVDVPAGMDVEVEPSKLHFTKNAKRLSFQVTFKLTTDSQKDLFGSITWSNGKYNVRSPFAIGFGQHKD